MTTPTPTATPDAPGPVPAGTVGQADVEHALLPLGALVAAHSAELARREQPSGQRGC